MFVSCRSMPVTLSRYLVDELSRLRQSGALGYLRPDGKSQVTVEYEGGKPTPLGYYDMQQHKMVEWWSE